MAKLELRFEKAVIGEFPVGERPVTIGRSPDNDITIDNLAVSTLHARVLRIENEYHLEDNGSLNGTFVNNRRVQGATIIRDGDVIQIGKHTVVFFEHLEAAAAAIPSVPKHLAPKIDETFVLETKKRVELLKNPVEAVHVAKRIPVGHLKVIAGKTDQPEYILTSKLTLIGKSEMASIRLRGWFKPATAGVITRKDDGYQVSPATSKPIVRVNGSPVQGPQPLHDGDIIEVSGIRFVFSLPSQD